MAYPEIWFRGLDEKRKKEFENYLKNSVVLDRFLEILQDWEKALNVRSADYDSPSWSHKQAHQNGMAEAYAKISKLFNSEISR